MPRRKNNKKKQPYKRRYYNNNRGSPWGNWVRRQAGTSSLWDIATSAAGSLITKFVNTEHKFFDYAPSALTPGTTGFVNALSLVPLGVAASEREGRQFRATSLYIRFVLRLAPAIVADAFRILLVQAKTDTVPVIGDILQSANTLAPRNLNEVRDYKVLSDKIYNLDAVKTQQIQSTLSLKLNHKVQFNTADTAGAATPEFGHLYLIAVGRENTLPTTMTYWSRLRYIDN